MDEIYVGDIDELYILQSELRNLAEVLKDMHELLYSSLERLNEDWLDEKYWEFRENFDPLKDKIQEMSESYSYWAEINIQDRINKTEGVSGSRMK